MKMSRPVPAKTCSQKDVGKSANNHQTVKIIWRELRLWLAEWLLLKALGVMPKGAEKKELAQFLAGYAKRKIQKFERERTKT